MVPVFRMLLLECKASILVYIKVPLKKIHLIMVMILVYLLLLLILKITLLYGMGTKIGVINIVSKLMLKVMGHSGAAMDTM